jgi:2-phosphosulfolactate phosphatase
VVAASLRNAAAVARRLVPRVSGGVAVIAAGEQWPDGSLRPALEDLWGAGAVISALLAAGADGVSPEARSAAAAYDAVADRLCVELAACASGRELVGSGFAQDVALAAELDASPVVPVLPPGERGFRAAPTAGW